MLNQFRLTLSGIATAAVAAVFLLLIAALIVQTARIEGFKFWPISVTGYKAELADAKQKLAGISSKKNEQAKVTTRTVERAKVIYRKADEQATKVEQAPLPGNCETPSLETLRNVL
jgi:hypothetical protein